MADVQKFLAQLKKKKLEADIAPLPPQPKPLAPLKPRARQPPPSLDKKPRLGAATAVEPTGRQINSVSGPSSKKSKGNAMADVQKFLAQLKKKKLEADIAPL